MNIFKKPHIISLLSLIATIPLLFFCLPYHWCMAGHNAHGQVHGIYVITDTLLLILLLISLLFSILDKNKKIGYYFMYFFTLFNTFAVRLDGMLILYVFLLIVHYYTHGEKDEVRSSENE